MQSWDMTLLWLQRLVMGPVLQGGWGVCTHLTLPMDSRRWTGFALFPPGLSSHEPRSETEAGAHILCAWAGWLLSPVAATPRPLALTGHCCTPESVTSSLPCLGAARSHVLPLGTTVSTMTAAWKVEMFFPHHFTPVCPVPLKSLSTRCLLLHLPHQEESANWMDWWGSSLSPDATSSTL